MNILLGLLLLVILGSATAVCPKEGCSFESVNHTYFIIPVQKNFYDALNECKDRNMSVVTIDSPEKVADVNFVLDKIFEDKPIPSLYIGAFDWRNSKFLWTASRDYLVFSNWYPGQPTGEYSRCAYIGRYKSGQWQSIQCITKIGYICEKMNF